MALKEDEEGGPKHLHTYVKSVVNDFQTSWKPEQYLANNMEQWNQLHLQLSAGRWVRRPSRCLIHLATLSAFSRWRRQACSRQSRRQPRTGSCCDRAAGGAAPAVAAGPKTQFGRDLAVIAANEREPHIGKVVLDIVHDLSGSKGASVDTPLMEAGVDSLAATELSNRLAKLTELTLPFTLLFEYPTSRAVSGYVLENSGSD